MRGLDGDRVLIVEDGLRMGDLSSQSGDHGVNVNPASASRIEVVRGPATLLYGANAIGGLVNVITNSERDADAHLIRARCHEMGAAEGRQEVVERFLIGHIDDAETQPDLGLVTVEQVVDAESQVE